MVEFNVLEHELVPSHELLTPKEAELMLKRYGITKDQLPKIRVCDPCIAALIDAGKEIKEGQIVKITRASDVAGVSVAYRLVVTA
jgi:DNA-directed RNA polymerase subunit H (RpoH/RPB5)